MSLRQGSLLLNKTACGYIPGVCPLQSPVWCWVVFRRGEICINTFHDHCLRAFLHLWVSRWHKQLHHVSYKDLHRRWGDIDLVLNLLHRRRLWWFGHASPMSDDRLPKKILFGRLPHAAHRRPAHGPRARLLWRYRVIASCHSSKKLTADDWYQLSPDRAAWSSIFHCQPIANAYFCVGFWQSSICPFVWADGCCIHIILGRVARSPPSLNSKSAKRKLCVCA